MVSRSQPERGGTRNPGKKGWGSERQRWSELYEGQVSLWFALGYSFIEHNEQILSGWCLPDSLHLIFVHCVWCLLGFLGGSDGKESICNMEDLGSVPGLGRSPGEGNGYPLQYSGLENSHGQRSLAGYSPWGHKELDTTEWLSLAHSSLWY